MDRQKKLQKILALILAGATVLTMVLSALVFFTGM